MELFRENKDAKINRLHLTIQQKEILKQLFKAHPERESMIDWNNPNLTWLDFDKVINYVSKSELKRKIKAGTAALSSLKPGVDYDIIKQEGPRTLYRIYTYQASCLIASNTVPPVLNSKVPYWAQNEENEWWDVVDSDGNAPGAHWCISMKRTIRHWNEYDAYKFYFFTDISRDDKFAKIAIFNEKFGQSVSIDKCAIWDAGDEENNYSALKWDAPDVYQFLKDLGDIFECMEGSIPNEAKNAIEEAFGIQVIQSSNSVEIKSNDVITLSYTYDLEEMYEEWTESIEFQVLVDDEVYEANREVVDSVFKKVAGIRGLAEEVEGNSLSLYVTNTSRTGEFCEVLKKIYDQLSQLEPILKEDHHILKDMAETSIRIYSKKGIVADGAKHIINDGVGSQLFYTYSNNKGEERFVMRMIFKEPLLPRNRRFEDIRVDLQKKFLDSQINLGYEQVTDSVKFEIYDTHIDLVLKGKKAEKKGFQMMNAVIRFHRFTESYLKNGKPPIMIRAF